MIIDIHTHTFPERIAASAVDRLSHTANIVPHTNGTNEQLLQSMHRAGIDMSVIMPVATSPAQVEKVNDASARLNDTYRDKGLFSFGCMHPDYENYHDELERIRSLGLKGIKLHPVYQDVCLDDIRMLRIISRAAELGLIVLTHAGEDIGFPGKICCSPQMCRHVVDEIGDFPFILAHMGGWRNWDVVTELLLDTRVYLDCAFSMDRYDPLPDGKPDDHPEMLSAEEMMRFISDFGADRILFGSDSPWTDQAVSLEFIRRLPLKDQERQAILGGNAAKLLRI
ncbi:MAG: amidohydrolase family protein [Clostridia bacterium]|nr:amidohydrolase family protein [Clostridia bacterium]